MDRGPASPATLRPMGWSRPAPSTTSGTWSATSLCSRARQARIRSAGTTSFERPGRLARASSISAGTRPSAMSWSSRPMRAPAINFSGPRDTLGFRRPIPAPSSPVTTIDYSDPNQIFVTDPRGWGGTGAERRAEAWLLEQPHRQRPNLAGPSGDFEGSRFQLPLERLSVGANYTNHKKSLTPDEAYVQFTDPTVRQLVLPDKNNLVPPISAGSALGHTLAFDPQQLLDAGIYTLVSNNFEPGRSGKSL